MESTRTKTQTKVPGTREFAASCTGRSVARRHLRRPDHDASARPTAMTPFADLLQTGELVPVIDSTWPLEAVPDAIRTLAAADAFGKLVIDVADANER